MGRSEVLGELGLERLNFGALLVLSTLENAPNGSIDCDTNLSVLGGVIVEWNMQCVSHGPPVANA